MLGLAGLAFAACGNEEEVGGNVTPEGNGAVSIKIVAPTVNSRGVVKPDKEEDGKIKVTGDITIALTAKFGSDQDETKTLTITEDEFNKGTSTVKFWNVKSEPTKVTVSMNGGIASYSNIKITEDGSADGVPQNMQATDKIPAYGESSTFEYKGNTGTPSAEEIKNGGSTGATTGDDQKVFYMYEATVDLTIPVARLEVSKIHHVNHVTDVPPTSCEYSKLTIAGVYMDNIQEYQDGDYIDYKFPGDNGTTATEFAAILSDKIDGEEDVRDFLNPNLSWPTDAAKVFAYNFYAPATDDDIENPATVNPSFKIYFDAAKEADNTPVKRSPRYAKIVNYHNGDGKPMVLLAGHVYRITNVELKDENIIGHEGGEEQWGVTVTVTEAAWTVETIEADWAQ